MNPYKNTSLSSQSAVAPQPTSPQGVQTSTPSSLTTPQPSTLPPAPVAPVANAPQTPVQDSGAAPKSAVQNTAQAALSMPANGSVVDLLTAAGQDASFAARQNLAKQYGIQSYTGSKTQNQDLAKRFLDAYNANKTKPIPNSGAEAAKTIDEHFAEQPPSSVEDPERKFVDSFAGMNPIVSNLFQQLSTAVSTQANQQSLTDFYKQEIEKQGIPGINVELADLNRIMNGTEDDIRAEITAAGGFATESNVQAMSTARNNTFLKKAKYLTDVLAAKEDYVDRVVSLTQADREQVSKDFDRKLGLTKTLADISMSMENAAKDNYKSIVSSVGWAGLAKALEGNKEQTNKVEKLFGLAPGELQTLASYKKPLSEKETLDLENQRLQNQKLKQDISEGPSVSTQVVDVGGKKVLINSKTGATIANLSEGSDAGREIQLAQGQTKLDELDSLLKDGYLSTAVGTNPVGRVSPLEWFTGGKSNFVGSMQNLLSGLTIDKLQQAKANGATFGSLTEGERIEIAASATKLNSPAWTVRDKAGNILGWTVSENTFKKEMDKINNFTKLDFILKGGDPTSAGVQQAADGSLWSKNSDGSVTQIK